MTKTKTRLTEIADYENQNDSNLNESDHHNHQQFEFQHFLMKNRLTQYIFKNNLNICSLNFKNQRLNKIVS